ncbi:TonB-dependent receptor [uncultured Brevundimonas sp.]|uniref:TonB-dependent receptor n=1 Tax=uncultured Brevundimonas sp. TaxID=213418 RepID=UPI0025CCF4B8|nr:TonB-dependent receptor [uncultured Brevundimonas sp.]
MKYLLLGAVSGVCVLSAGNVLAQDIVSTSQPAPSDGPSTLDDIVVTAQRRSERLQDVPISVTALSSERLEDAGIVSTEDLTTVTPGLVFARSNQFAQPTIRGVGSRNGSQGDESSVAIYIDGVYRPEQFSNLFELEGVEQIEVLKGPQGTLFGRNAAGGAINITTRMPDADPDLTIALSAGDFGYWKAAGYVSGPLTERLSANLAVTALQDDGFVRNIFLNKDSGSRELLAARTKLVFDIDDASRLWLGLSYQDGRDNTNQSGQPLAGNSRGRRVPGSVTPSEPWTTATQFIPISKGESFAADLHYSREFAGFDLRAVLAYSEASQYNLTDSDNTSAAVSGNDTTFKASTYSFEAVLASSGGGRWNWTLGGNLFSNESVLDPFISGATNFAGRQKAQAASVFGELVFEPVTGLFLTGGLRASYEERSARFNQRTPTVVAAEGEDQWSDISPRLVARYQFARNANVYASYTRGFKSGTFNSTSAVGASVPADPEYVDAFEIGLKTDLAQRARLSLAAYHYDYQDLQVTVPLFINGATTFALSNAAQSTIQGLEANIEASLTDRLNLRFGGSLLDARYDEFPDAVVLEPDPALFFNGAPAGNRQVVRDVSGNRLSRSPEWTWSLGLDYTLPLFGGDLRLGADAYGSARWYSDPLNRIVQPDYALVNASARWTSPSGRWSALVSAENLTDEAVYSNMFTSALGDFVAYQRPRFVSFTLKFDL